MKNKKDIVVKKNESVKSKLTKTNTIQLKIFNYLVSKLDSRIKLNLKSFEEEIIKTLEDYDGNPLMFKINRSELFELVGSNNSNFVFMRKNLTELSNLKITEIDEKKRKYKLINVFNEVDYEDGDIKFYFNYRVLNHFQGLENSKNFTKYYLENILVLKSKHSILIYEILKMDLFKGDSVWELDKLKEKLQVENKFKLYSNFKKDLLLKVEKEINEKTDINFSFEEIKIGRKVSKINFKIWKNTNKKNIFNDEKEFINFIRKNYINQPILDLKGKNNFLFKLAVNPEGKLYPLNSSQRWDYNYSKKLWNILFLNQSQIYKFTPPFPTL
jgi:plasmid replication initiation protein